MSANEPIVIDPSVNPQPNADNFEPIDPATHKWKQGEIIQVQTKLNFEWCPITYNLKIVKPVSFEELTALVRNAVKSSGEDIFKHLFSEWFTRLSAIELIEVESFKVAAAKFQASKTGSNGNGQSAS